mmetsp:Transcript_51946/g.93402  ORF Transcript_51946/g.93402 Transcript_51946/m.93402 type:complete len:361 (-) Transcript_51946:67-1149(-)
MAAVLAGGGIHEDDEWACLTQADLEADLAESEEAVAPVSSHLLNPQGASEEELQRLVQSGAAPSFDVGSLFKARRTLHGVAVDLQSALAEVEALQFASAALVASLLYGPLRPSSWTAAGSPVQWKAAEEFGSSAVPAAPPSLELDPPASAGSLADYQRRLTGLPRSLFVPRDVRLCMREVDKYQDEKDINRDELRVNGAPISGARGGYVAAVAAIAGALHTANADGGREAWCSEAEEHAAQMILGILNRTSSGFAAFEEVLRLFDCPEVVLVAPESAAARPLECAVLKGLVLCHAHTRYSVRRSDGSGAPVAVIDAIFAFRIPTALLKRLVERPDGQSSWPIEELPAAVLLGLPELKEPS